ncbi:hypothetical protein [Burkholderia multivorans]|uniref:hypothetical protein n=1 Tax=Burkholderia multivorans TaxID=87883 RepID=UPI003F5677A3
MSSMIGECATTDNSAERPMQFVRVRAGAQRAASRAVGASPRLPSTQSCACASLAGRAVARQRAAQACGAGRHGALHHGIEKEQRKREITGVNETDHRGGT